jgi:hypothetical protein
LHHYGHVLIADCGVWAGLSQAVCWYVGLWNYPGHDDSSVGLYVYVVVRVVWWLMFSRVFAVAGFRRGFTAGRGGWRGIRP